MAGEHCNAGCGYCGACEADYRAPCAECGEPASGIWCQTCMDRWRAQEQRERDAERAALKATA